MKKSVLLLTPSCGLGGGIERYAETLEWVLASKGILYQRLDLTRGDTGSRLAHQARLVARSRKTIATMGSPVQVIVVHRSLLPAAALILQGSTHKHISVICHGSDVWGRRPAMRRTIENRLMRSPGVRVIAVSSYTAGALSQISGATVLPPGLSEDWYEMLVNARTRFEAAKTGRSIITAFRLSQWREKGLPQLVTAISKVNRAELNLTICGIGEPPPDLRNFLGAYPNCILRSSLADNEFAHELAKADLFVLATRTKPGRQSSGEGFGLVLLESQVAGTPVIAPAFGGSHDAYLDGWTGLAPSDETSSALALVLSNLLQQPYRLSHMGDCAASWAQERFSPEKYAELAISRIFT